jgi:hypothetical protein
LGGQLVLPGHPPLRADVALNYDEAVARTAPRVRDVGDLREAIALDTVDATGLFVHPDSTVITEREGSRWLRLGAPGLFDIRRGPAVASALVLRVE